MRGGVLIRRRRVWCSRTCSANRWPGGNTQIESVDELVVRRIINTDLSRLAENRRTRKRENQVRVRIYVLCSVAWKPCDGRLGRRRSWDKEQPSQQYY